MVGYRLRILACSWHEIPGSKRVPEAVEFAVDWDGKWICWEAVERSELEGACRYSGCFEVRGIKGHEPK
jgi:hypothetical protein